MSETSKKILIVDDEEFLREALCEEIKFAGFETWGAPNVKAAIQLLKERHFDAILSDMRMPGGNGDELLDYVRNVDVETPAIFFLTGYSDLAEEDLYARGAAKIFSKPFDLQKVVESIHYLLQDRSQRWLKKIERGVNALVEVKNGNLLSLGQGGMFLSLKDKFSSVGDLVSFSIELGEHKIEGSGYIRWIRNSSPNETPGMGIEFSALSPASLEVVNTYLKMHQPKAYIPSH